MGKRRGKGEGSISKRKDGRYMAQISLGNDPITGKRKRKTIYGKNQKDVRAQLINLLAEAQKGINIAPEKITLGMWIRNWLDNYAKFNVREVTWNAYDMNYKVHIQKSIIADKELSKLTTGDLQSYFRTKLDSGKVKGSGGLSVGSVIKLKNIIRAALTQAEEEGLVQRNVAKAVKLPSERENRKPITPLSKEQTIQFLNSIANDKYYPAYALELTTGMRRGELLGLKWEDIDFDSGELEIKRSLTRLITGEIQVGLPKTKQSNRIVAIPERVLNILAEHKAKQNIEKMKLYNIYNDDDLVFATELGHPLDPNVFYHDFCRKLKKANLDHISFHALRHSVATILMDEGVSLKVVSELLGHASVAVTGDIYSHVTRKAKHQTANILNQIIRD